MEEGDSQEGSRGAWGTGEAKWEDQIGDRIGGRLERGPTR